MHGVWYVQVIAHHAACARQRLAASGASTLFVATMHIHMLKRSEKNSLRQRVGHSRGWKMGVGELQGARATARSSCAPVARPRQRDAPLTRYVSDARVPTALRCTTPAPSDIPRLALTRSAASTMGYVALALAQPATRVTMLEASFLSSRTRWPCAFRRPHAARDGASCRQLAGEMVSTMAGRGRRRPGGRRLCA